MALRRRDVEADAERTRRVRHSRPDSGLDLKTKVLVTVQVDPKKKIQQAYAKGLMLALKGGGFLMSEVPHETLLDTR